MTQMATLAEKLTQAGIPFETVYMDKNIFGAQLQKSVFGWCKKLIETAKTRTEEEK